MSTWTVPLSSSPQTPSTPEIGHRNTSNLEKPQNGILKNPFPPNPSTTPAGPPPSSARSFTPAGPPPSSIFGSSQMGPGKTLFKSKGSSLANNSSRRSVTPVSSSTIDENKLARYLDKSGDFVFGAGNGLPAKHRFDVPSSSPPGSPLNDEGPYENESEEFGEDANDYETDEVDDAVLENGDSTQWSIRSDNHPRNPSLDVSSMSHGSFANGNLDALGSSILDATPRGIKRSRGGLTISDTSSPAKPRSKVKEKSAIATIARGFVSQNGVAKLAEQDDFILGTEEIVEKDLYGNEASSELQGLSLTERLPRVCEKLINFWQLRCDQDLAKLHQRQDFYERIGPDERAPATHKATFVSSILLQLHHPPPAKGKQALALARLNRSSIRSKLSQSVTAPSSPTAIPKVLIDWLSKNHDPYEACERDVRRCQPNPTAHFNYWDIIFSLTLRGKVAGVVHLLKSSNFLYARTVKDDRKDDDNYSVVQVRNIERVANRAIQVLESCPIVQDDDWHVTGNEWIIFRKRIDQANQDLTGFAAGNHYGKGSTTTSLSQSVRKAESQVPWTVYKNLKAVYGILLGGTTEILSMAQDWVEATIGLTVWWLGDDDEDIAVGSVAVSRRSLRQSQARGPRLVDVSPIAAYLRRLSFAFETVNSEDNAEKGLAMDTLDPVSVGLASAFEGNLEGVIGLLKTWSLPIASAVAEIASAGGWFEVQAGANVMQGLDSSDLMLLSVPAPPELPITKDAVLSEYAAALSNRGEVFKTKKGDELGGWQVAITVLAHLDDEEEVTKLVSKLLQRVFRKNDHEVEKILRACGRFDLKKEASEIAESYADHIIDISDQYGTALTYYARAHSQKKLKDVLDLLISLSLVQSAAYPISSNLDRNLGGFIDNPKVSLHNVAKMDTKAATMLRTSLTGYATLRRFYALRDEEVQPAEGQQPTMGPIARKHAAAAALIAVINSAADSIHGGLYDEKRDTVVQVDGLLALLGEALMFVNRKYTVTPSPLKCILLTLN